MHATSLWPRRDRLALEATAALLDFDYERAADNLQALTQFFPEPETARQLVETLIDAGRLRTAEEALQSLRLQYPKDPRMALLTARLADAERDHEARLDAAREAVLLAEGDRLEALLPDSETGSQSIAFGLTSSSTFADPFGHQLQFLLNGFITIDQRLGGGLIR